jgi:hypothetical protein
VTPRVLSLIPPMTQLNTPYPSTAYLTGFLRSRGFHAVQVDLALALVLRLLLAPGLQMRSARSPKCMPPKQRTPQRGRKPSSTSSIATWPASTRPLPCSRGATRRIATASAGRAFLPEGPRFAALDNYVDDEGGDPLAWAFGALGVQDRARHLATLYLNDLADVLRDAVDTAFRVRPLCRIAGPEPGQLRAAGHRAGRAADPGRRHAGAPGPRGHRPPCSRRSC